MHSNHGPFLFLPGLPFYPGALPLKKEKIYTKSNWCCIVLIEAWSNPNIQPLKDNWTPHPCTHTYTHTTRHQLWAATLSIFVTILRALFNLFLYGLFLFFFWVIMLIFLVYATTWDLVLKGKKMFSPSRAFVALKFWLIFLLHVLCYMLLNILFYEVFGQVFFLAGVDNSFYI